MNELIISNMDFSRLLRIILNQHERKDSMSEILNYLILIFKHPRYVQQMKNRPDTVSIDSEVVVVFAETCRDGILRGVYYFLRQMVNFFNTTKDIDNCELCYHQIYTETN